MNRLFRVRLDTSRDTRAAPSVRWIVASSIGGAMAEIEFTLARSSVEKIEDGSKLFRDCIEIDEQELESAIVCSPHREMRRFQGKTLREAISILGD